MSHRPKQVASLLKRLISEILIKEMSDPRLSGFVSITRVQVSPDMHDAYVYMSVMPTTHAKRALAALNHAAGHIQSLVRKGSSLGSVPRLNFRLDETLKKQAEVFDAIHRGLAEDAERQAARGELPEGDAEAASDTAAEFEDPTLSDASADAGLDSSPEDRDS